MDIGRRCMRIAIFSILMIFCPLLVFAEQDLVSVKGKVIINSTERIKGIISFFNKSTGPEPDPKIYLRIPDEVLELKENGTFEGKIKPATYYVGIALNNTGKKGPLKIGDYYQILPATVSLENVKTFDFGLVNLCPQKLEQFVIKTAIKGIVVDEDGKPVPDVYVFASLKESKTKKPLFISEKTDKEGRFLLRVAGNGSYLLKVRSLIDNGKPQPNSVFGTYGDYNNPETINIKDSEIIENIKIKVEKYSNLKTKK